MPWLRSYPDDIVKKIDPNRYASLADLLTHAYSTYADAIAVSNLGGSMSYQQLEKYSLHFAAYLQNTLNLKKGDRIAIMMPNVMQYVVVLHAAIRAGLVVVNINPLYTARELKQQLTDSEVKAIVVINMRAATLAQILPETLIEHVIITTLGDMLDFPRGFLVNFAVKYIKHLVPTWHIAQSVTFKDVLAQGANLNFQPPQIGPDDLAFLQYTGGTTGIPKGAMLTHRNIIANALQCQAWFGEKVYELVRLTMAPLPLYHIFSMTLCVFTVTLLGGQVELITDPRNIKSLVKLMRKLPITAIIGINTLFNALLHNPQFQRLKFPHLKLTVAGGMATQNWVAQEWHRVTGTYILEGYGLTETSPVVCVNPYTAQNFSGSIGLPLPSTMVDIRDTAGNSLPFGEVGEIYVQGPQVMKWYWHNPQETQQVLDGKGWLRTGDIAHMDAQGYVYLVDRKKDMILVSGFNVYPNEIENVVAMLPGVLECAVVGAPNTQTGESVKLFVVKKDPNLTATMIADYCRENLTGYKRPHEIVFCEQLPKNNVGKVLRRELRESA